jgi:putative Holliday junction resolvase
MGRWLAIDHGTARVGTAVGDTAAGLASPLEGLGGDDPALAERIAALAAEYGVEGVVVGWPLNDDGTEGPQGKAARRFAVDLAERTGLEVRLWDETLSTYEAGLRLRGQLTRAKKKRREDSIAAQAFLEGFLEQDGPGKAPRAESIAD